MATQTATVEMPPVAALESGPPSPLPAPTPSGLATPPGIVTPASVRAFPIDQFHGLTRTRRILIMGLIMFANFIQVSHS